AEDKQAVAAIDAAYKRFLALDAPTWAAIRAGNVAKAQKLTLGPEIVAYDNLSAAVDAFVKQAGEEVTGSESSFASTKSSSTTLMLVVGALALLLSAALAFVIARGIKRGVGQVLAGLRRLDEEDLTSLSAG